MITSFVFRTVIPDFRNLRNFSAAFIACPVPNKSNCSNSERSVFAVVKSLLDQNPCRTAAKIMSPIATDCIPRALSRKSASWVAVPLKKSIHTLESTRITSVISSDLGPLPTWACRGDFWLFPAFSAWPAKLGQALQLHVLWKLLLLSWRQIAVCRLNRYWSACRFLRECVYKR